MNTPILVIVDLLAYFSLDKSCRLIFQSGSWRWAGDIRQNCWNDSKMNWTKWQLILTFHVPLISTVRKEKLWPGESSESDFWRCWIIWAEVSFQYSKDQRDRQWEQYYREFLIHFFLASEKELCIQLHNRSPSVCVQKITCRQFKNLWWVKP